MDGRVRWLAFGAVAVAVIAFFALFAPQTMPGAESARKRAAEQAARASIIDCTPNPVFEKQRALGLTWQFLRYTSGRANERDKIDFNPFSITCNPTTGARDVWIQITHPAASIKTVEDETTIQEISYTRERYLYRIDCVGRKFAVLEQLWMGDGPEEVAHRERLAGDAPDLRPISPGGIAEALAGPTCSTGRL